MFEQASTSQIFSDLQEELKIFGNFPTIVRKLENDGMLQSTADFLRNLFESELGFAFEELSKLKENMKKAEIRYLIKTNLRIFKENLRTILLFSTDYIFDSLTKEENLNNVIIKHMNKGKFEEIQEVDDENQKSSFISNMNNTVS